MKTLKCILAVLAISLMSITCMAYDFKVDGFCYNVNDDNNTVTFTYETPIMIALDAPSPSEKGYVGDIVIPSTVKHNGKNYKVTAIGQYAFSGNTELRSVEIPSTVKTIEPCAFIQCFSLKSVKLPSGLKVINGYTFAECGSLRDITIPASVTRIGESAFNGCSLKSITIPNSVTEIEKSAFSCCRWLETMTMGNKVESIGEAAFSICPSLKAVKLPGKLRKIGSKAFYECGMTSVSIPASVTEIGDGAFRTCHNLTDITVDKGNKRYDSRGNCNAIVETSTNTIIAACKNSTIPQSVTTIGGEAFYGCSGMTSIDIPASVTKIGDHAFFYCTDLKKVELPSSLVEIGGYAFVGCDSLEAVTIPSSVKTIGESAFLHDKHITRVTIGSSVTRIGTWAFKGLDAATAIVSNITDPGAVKMGSAVFDEIDTTACTLYVPAGTAALYRKAKQWQDFKNIVEN